MPTFEELDALPTKELHDRAVHHAERHANVKFLWQLIKAVPAATAAAGGADAGAYEVESGTAQVRDALENDDDGVHEQLRPMYIAYLQEHTGA